MVNCLKTFQLEICGVPIKLHLEAASPLENQTAQTIFTCISGEFPPSCWWILSANYQSCPARITHVALSALLMSHLLQFSHSAQMGSAILIKLRRSFCDCTNHRERRTSNTVCMKSTSKLASTRDKTPGQVKCEANQPLLSFSFFKSNLYHLRSLFFKKKPVRTLSSDNWDCIHKSNTVKSLIFKSVFSASPYLFKQRNCWTRREQLLSLFTHTHPQPAVSADSTLTATATTRVFEHCHFKVMGSNTKWNKKADSWQAREMFASVCINGI